MTDGEVFDPMAAPTDPPLMTPGERVRELRAAASMSQQRLADVMRARGFDHWRQNTVSRVERGDQEPSMAELGALSSILEGDILKGTREGLELKLAMSDMGHTITKDFMGKRLRDIEQQLVGALDAVRELQALTRPRRDRRGE